MDTFLKRLVKAFAPKPATTSAVQVDVYPPAPLNRENPRITSSISPVFIQERGRTEHAYIRGLTLRISLLDLMAVPSPISYQFSLRLPKSHGHSKRLASAKGYGHEQRCSCGIDTQAIAKCINRLMQFGIRN